MSTPSPRQVLGCKVRAAREAYEHARRKPLGGGWELPSREETYAYHARKFAELMELELSELRLGDLLWTQETDDDRDLQRNSY